MGIGLLIITGINEKGGVIKVKHFVLLHHQSMSIDMLNLNQHYKQLLPTMAVWYLCPVSIVNLEHCREKDTGTLTFQLF